MHLLRNVTSIKRHGKWPLGRSFRKTVLARPVDGLFPKIFCFITIENEVLYNLTVNQNIISRYVKVIQTLRLFFLRLMHNLVHFQI